MKYDITEEQFLIYVHGEKKTRAIIDNNLQDHYRETYQKLQNGQNFVWNWAAFFFGALWFIYQGMPLAFFAFFISMSIITIITTVTLGTFGFFASCILFGILSGFLSDGLLINRLSAKLKNGYFGDLNPDTQSKFIEKMGVTEEQYLTFIYGEEKAQSLIKYNIPNHYREAFKKFALGKILIWNWATFYFSQLWFLYRRLPHWNLFFSFLMILLWILPLWILPPLLGDRLLINYISKQSRKGNLNALPKSGSPMFVFGFVATFLGIGYLFYIIGSITILTAFSAFSAFMIVPIIQIIHTKYKIWRYKQSIKSE